MRQVYRRGRSDPTTGPCVIRSNVTRPNPGLNKATLLDVAGFATPATVTIEKTGTGVQLTLPENAMYVVLTDK